MTLTKASSLSTSDLSCSSGFPCKSGLFFKAGPRVAEQGRRLKLWYRGGSHGHPGTQGQETDARIPLPHWRLESACTHLDESAHRQQQVSEHQQQFATDVGAGVSPLGPKQTRRPHDQDCGCSDRDDGGNEFAQAITVPRYSTDVEQDERECCDGKRPSRNSRNEQRAQRQDGQNRWTSVESCLSRPGDLGRDFHVEDAPTRAPGPSSSDGDGTHQSGRRWDDQSVPRNVGEFAAAMAEFEAQLRNELSELAAVTRGRHKDLVIEGVDVEPRNPKSVGFYWLDSGEFQFGVGAAGNRWELNDDVLDAEFAIDLARSIIQGRVRQTTARARSHIVVTFRDGSEIHDTAYSAPAGLIPIPGWKRRRPTTQYEPYDSTAKASG